MTDKIPKPEADLMPLGTILPFINEQSVASGYTILRGQVIHRKDNPDLVAKMWRRWNAVEIDHRFMQAKLFWHEKGGMVLEELIVLPTISPQEVTGVSFGAIYLPPDACPVLAIKTKRTIINDGKASDVDYSDSDT